VPGLDSSATQAALAAMLARVTLAAKQVASKGALAVEAAGMALTAVRTGTLRRSWIMTGPEPLGLGFAAQTGPTTVYARRQELGFRGPDSLGRLFRWQGKPYVKPAVEEVTPVILAYAQSAYIAAIEG